jgi:hypothetical protein
VSSTSPAFRAHLRKQLAAGPGTILPVCGTGEFFSLSETEYRELIITVDGTRPTEQVHQDIVDRVRSKVRTG